MRFRYGFTLWLLMAVGLSAQVLQLKEGDKITIDSLHFEAGQFATPAGPIFRDAVRKISFSSATSDSGTTAAVGQVNDTIRHYMAVAESIQAKYPDAGGIVLLDHGIDIWQKDGKNKHISHNLLKILKPSRKEWGTLSFWYEEERNKIKILRARSISPAGVVQDFDPKSVTIGEPSRGMEFFSRGKVMSVTIPGVDVGSLVEIMYENEEFNPNDSLLWFPRFYFQDNEPVVDSWVDMVIPKDHTLYYKTYNIPDNLAKPKITESAETKTYTWEMHRLEPLIDEPQMPSFREITPGLQASLFEKNDYLFDWLGSFQKARIALTPEIQAEVDQVTAGKNTLEEKVAAIYLYCQRNIRYVSIKGSVSSAQTGHAAFETYKNKYGDCTDKSILFATMLKAVGVTAEPLIIMTNDAGQVDRTLPSIIGNHAISMVHLNGKDMILDATATTHRFPYWRSDDVDVSYINAIARKIGRTPMPLPDQNSKVTERTFVIDTTGAVTVKQTINMVGDYEAGWRGYFQNQQENRLPSLFSNWASGAVPGADLKDYHLNNLNDLEKAFSVDFSFSAPALPIPAGPYWILKPPGVENNFKFSEIGSATRKYDLVYRAPQLDGMVDRFVLPPGVHVISMPDSANIQSPYFSYTAKYQTIGDTLIYRSEFKRLARVVPAKAYPDYRTALSKMQKSLSQRVFLSKPAPLPDPPPPVADPQTKGAGQ